LNLERETRGQSLSYKKQTACTKN